MVHIYNGILLSYIKERSNTIFSNLDEPRDDHTKCSKPDKDKYLMIHLYVESKKWYKWTYLQKQKQTHKHKKIIYSYQRGNDMGEG